MGKGGFLIGLALGGVLSYAACGRYLPATKGQMEMMQDLAGQLANMDNCQQRIYNGVALLQEFGNHETIVKNLEATIQDCQSRQQEFYQALQRKYKEQKELQEQFKGKLKGLLEKAEKTVDKL